MAARTIPAKAGLDLEVLGKMVEPITVHVTRVRGGNTQLILMPPRDGHDADGTGWTKPEIAAIDTEILDAAGSGGLFEIQLSDSTSPQPIHHKYRTEIPLEIYPMAPKPPYPYDGQLPPAGYGVSWSPAPGWGWGPGPTNGWGARSPIGAAPATSDEATRLRDQLHQHQLAAQQREFEFSRRLDVATQAPRDDGRLEREREERLRAERVAEAERQRAERLADEARHREEMNGLKTMVTSLAEAVRASQSAPKNDEAAALRAELAEERRRREEADRRRDDEARLAEERRRNDAMLNELRQSMQLLQQQVTAKPAGPDPMIMMLIEWMKMTAQTSAETARLAAETAKEEARARAEETRAATAQTATMMETISKAASAGNIPPLELMRMLREASSGADTLTRTMVSSMTDMMELQRNATANLLSMAPQGEGVAGRIVTAIEHGVERFSDMQATTAAAHANAQATVARAQADALMAQAAMAGAPGVVPPASAAPKGQGGMPPPPAGAPAATPIRGPIVPPSAGPPVPDPLAAGGGLGAPPATTPPVAVGATDNVIPLPVAPLLRHGKTDAEWFGQALPRVLELREAVCQYLDATEADAVDLAQLKPNEPITIVDDKNVPIGASPFTAADYIVKAAGQIVQLQQVMAAEAQAAGQPAPPLGIPAFEVLFAQQMYPALLDVLLPDPVPQEYRVDVIRYLHRHLTGQTLHSDVDPPMHGIEAFLPPPEKPPAGQRPPKGRGGNGRARA